MYLECNFKFSLVLWFFVYLCGRQSFYLVGFLCLCLIAWPWYSETLVEVLAGLRKRERENKLTQTEVTWEFKCNLPQFCWTFLLTPTIFKTTFASPVTVEQTFKQKHLSREAQTWASFPAEGRAVQQYGQCHFSVCLVVIWFSGKLWFWGLNSGRSTNTTLGMSHWTLLPFPSIALNVNC